MKPGSFFFRLFGVCLIIVAVSSIIVLIANEGQTQYLHSPDYIRFLTGAGIIAVIIFGLALICSLFDGTFSS